MNQYTKEELEEALRAIDSTICKCQKVKPKLKEGTSQHTLLIRRIKAFQIAASLITQALENQSQNGEYINQYKWLLQTTNLQNGYQEFIKLFRSLRTYLQKELPQYTFTGNIVENNMDYSYFQFTDEELKEKGLKVVIAFVHADFTYQIWLSGVNREIQRNHYDVWQGNSHPYVMTDSPNKTDFILKSVLIEDWDYNNTDGLLRTIKENAVEFIQDVKRFISSNV